MDEPGLLHEPLTLTAHLSPQPGVLPYVPQVKRLIETRHQEGGFDVTGVRGGRDSCMLSPT